MNVDCWSKGIEVVPARVAFCIDQKFNFQEKHQSALAKMKNECPVEVVMKVSEFEAIPLNERTTSSCETDLNVDIID